MGYGIEFNPGPEVSDLSLWSFNVGLRGLNLLIADCMLAEFCKMILSVTQILVKAPM